MGSVYWLIVCCFPLAHFSSSLSFAAGAGSSMCFRARNVFPPILAAIIGLAAVPARGLNASELALIVNRNMPEGLKLAQLYAERRQVPDNRIIELDLPRTEQMSFEDYERNVVPPVREFLRLNDPQRHVKCLLTFYGVPFRIAAHVDSAEETAELKLLHAQLNTVGKRLESLADESEKMARLFDPSFTPAVPSTSLAPGAEADDHQTAHPAGAPSAGAAVASGGDVTAVAIDALARRVDHAGKSMVLAIRAMVDPQQRQNAQMQLEGIVQSFDSPIQIEPAPATAASSAGGGTAATTTDAVVAALPLEDRRFDPASRELIRRDAAQHAGLFSYARLLCAQIAYLSPEDTEAATDSELSLLWWTFYPRPRWQLNSLCYRFGSARATPSLMVSRLDAPTPEIVNQMMLDSIQAENQGLHGHAVIDARGLSLDGPGGKIDSYAIYDESLRKLAALIRLKTKLPLTFDDKPAVLPAHSVQDVALYCGWYSVGRYVPACSFVPGAVGFHIASYEMISLRDPGNTGWVRGLLNDGIAATLGPVSEPYLQAFPPPNDFFPLLLTGRLTLAEVYWKTEIMASWRMCLVGDPLYKPFKNDPQMKVRDLPLPLQSIFAQTSAGAAAGPAAATH
jgi:uncharacterized protein (TIGR03790 family)